MRVRFCKQSWCFGRSVQPISLRILHITVIKQILLMVTPKKIDKICKVVFTISASLCTYKPTTLTLSLHFVLHFIFSVFRHLIKDFLESPEAILWNKLSLQKNTKLVLILTSIKFTYGIVLNWGNAPSRNVILILSF